MTKTPEAIIRDLVLWINTKSRHLPEKDRDGIQDYMRRMGIQGSVFRAASIPTQPWVRVKPLEWGVFGGVTPLFSTYSVRKYDDGRWGWHLTYGPEQSGRYATQAEAKAAAQQDYEQRMRSAIEVAPQPAPVVTDEMPSAIAADICALETIIEWSDGRSTDEQWAELHGAVQAIVTAALHTKQEGGE